MVDITIANGLINQLVTMGPHIVWMFPEIGVPPQIVYLII